MSLQRDKPPTLDSSKASHTVQTPPASMDTATTRPCKPMKKLQPKLRPKTSRWLKGMPGGPGHAGIEEYRRKRAEIEGLEQLEDNVVSFDQTMIISSQESQELEEPIVACHTFSRINLPRLANNNSRLVSPLSTLASAVTAALPFIRTPNSPPSDVIPPSTAASAPSTPASSASASSASASSATPPPPYSLLA